MLSKENKGITLVALVITIIILLILATISIQSLTNTGLFAKAKEAKEKTQKAEENQVKTLNEYEDAMNEYLQGTTDEKSEKLADKVKVGDYVKYIPDTASTDSILQELVTYSGSDANTTSTLAQEKDLKWRVLDVQNGQVRLISEVPTTSTITLSGAKGYNNAVYLLDKTCKILYSKNGYSEKVQNLKIEDIQKYLTYDYTQYENLNVDTGKYGGTVELTENKKYPSLFAKEKTGLVDGKQGIELDLSEQLEPINEGSIQAETNIKIMQTYWNKIMETRDFNDNKYYELFINNGNNYPTYWMSSRCVCAYPGIATFCIRCIYSGYVHTSDLYHSNDDMYSYNYAFRPVVTLNSNVQIDTANSGDGSTAEQAYVIK